MAGITPEELLLLIIGMGEPQFVRANSCVGYLCNLSEEIKDRKTKVSVN